MKNIRLYFYFLWFTLFCVAPAYGDPVTAFLVTYGVSAATAATITSVLIDIAISSALSILQMLLIKKPLPPGIQIERTLNGGANSRTFQLGLYATAGSFVTPPMSSGNLHDVPNALLTQIIAISDVYTPSLNAIILNGERTEIDWSTTHVGNIDAHTVVDYGHPVFGKYANRVWIKYYDGSQTAADPDTVTIYNSYPGRPWTADRIGKGCAYAILTYRYDTNRFQGEPTVKFETGGIPLYDPRKDSTRGGSGSHLADNPATWEPSNNGAVQIYNLLHGISLGDSGIYGGNVPLEDLPLDNWVAGMNVCDETVTTSAGSEPRFRSGYEVLVSDNEPADIIEELEKAISAQIVETGGVYRIRVGPPALPVFFMSDDDIIVSSEQDFEPIAEIQSSCNAIYGTYPSPAENWNNHDAPPIINADYLAEDDGKEISGDLQLNACPYPLQVQRNMLAWLTDNRRARKHNFVLGPYGFALEPLDTISWTSARNGYDAKLFEISTSVRRMTNAHNKVALREVDPSDYDWSPELELPDNTSDPVWSFTPEQDVPGWSVSPSAVLDDGGIARRAAILCQWTSTSASDATGLEIQVRLLADASPISDTTVGQNIIALGETTISEGIINATTYQARAKYLIQGRDTAWSDWVDVTTADIKLGPADGVDAGPPPDARYQWSVATEADLPATYQTDKDVYYVVATGKLYTWDGTAYTARVDATDIDGQIVADQLNAIIGGGNLVRNSGFEYAPFSLGSLGTIADGFQYYNNSPGEGEHWSLVTGRRGGLAQRTEWSSNTSTKGIYLGYNGGVENRYVFRPYTTFVWSFWAKGAGSALGNYLALAWNNAPISIVEISNPNLTANWQRYAFRITWGATADANGFIYCHYAGGVAGSFDLDDMQVEEGDTLTAYSPAFLPGEVRGPLIAGGAVDTTQLANGSVINTKVATSAIETAKLADGAVIAVKITDGEISTPKIAANAITAGKVAADTLTSNEIAANAITALEIAANAVTTVKIIANAIVTSLINAGAVVTASLAALAVTANEIASNAITSVKIAANAITTTHISANAITANEIAANAVTAGKIMVATLSSIAADIGTITAGLIQNVAGTMKVDLTNGRIVFDNGTTMLVQGNGFGSTNQFINWFGPSMAISSCTEANGRRWDKTDGTSYYGGDLRIGTLVNSFANSSNAGGPVLETPVFGSNGGTIVTNVNYAAVHGPNVSTGSGYYFEIPAGPAPGTYTATLSLYRSIGGSAYGSPVSSVTCNGYDYWNIEVSDPDMSGIYNWTITSGANMSGSLTYTDPSLSASDRQYKAVISSNTMDYFAPYDQQNLSFTAVEE